MKFKLSGREEEIMDLICRGKRDKQIAAFLEVHEQTLRVAILRTVAKLGARTRCEAVAKYLKGPDDGTD